MFDASIERKTCYNCLIMRREREREKRERERERYGEIEK